MEKYIVDALFALGIAIFTFQVIILIQLVKISSLLESVSRKVDHLDLIFHKDLIVVFRLFTESVTDGLAAMRELLEMTTKEDSPVGGNNKVEPPTSEPDRGMSFKPVGIKRNGIVAPSVTSDTQAAYAWAIFNEEANKQTNPVTDKQCYAACTSSGVLKETVDAELPRWRKFHGITTPKAKTPVNKKAAPKKKATAKKKVAVKPKKTGAVQPAKPFTVSEYDAILLCYTAHVEDKTSKAALVRELNELLKRNHSIKVYQKVWLGQIDKDTLAE